MSVSKAVTSSDAHCTHGGVFLEALRQHGLGSITTANSLQVLEDTTRVASALLSHQTDPSSVLLLSGVDVFILAGID